MLVSEIHENVDLVLGIKNIFELEGIINLRESCFSFLNVWDTILPKATSHIETERTTVYKNRSPFCR